MNATPVRAPPIACRYAGAVDLHPGEHIVFEGHPSWRALLSYYVSAVGGAVVIAVIVALVSDVGLAIVVAVFRGRRNVDVDRLTTLRN